MKANYNEVVDKLKEIYGVDKVYSYSQVKLYTDDLYEYYLKYVAKVKPDKTTSSPYGVIGGMVHDILEKFYKNEIKRSDCKTLFIEQFNHLMNLPTTGVFSQDHAQNRTISDNFIRDISDYFDRVEKLEGKVFCEEPIGCLLENDNTKAVFMGYIDFLNFNKDKVYIIDYKTSTIYKEKDIPKYSRQLILYAESVRKKYGIKYDNIVVGWNFLKYAKLINKVDLSEEIVERKDLYKYDLDNYVVEDCIITIDFNESVEEDFNEYICNTVIEIENRVKIYEDLHDDSIFMYEVNQSHMFRLTNFCNYSEKYHKPLREYLERNKNIYA